MTGTKGYASEPFVPLLESIHELLRDLPVRAPMDSVQVVARQPWEILAVVQLAAGSSLGAVTRGLVEWNATLVDGQFLAERSACGGMLRLGLAGRTDDDTTVEVWGVLTYASKHTGLLLDPGQRIHLTVSELAYWMLDDWTPDDETSEWANRPTTTTTDDGDGVSGEGDGSVAP